MPNLTREKTCDGCSAKWPVTTILCRGCDDVLEDAPYRRLIWRCLLFGFVVQTLVGRFGDDSLLGGTMHHMVTALFVLYPLRKIADKVTDWRRRVLWEMGSLFSDRVSRGLVIAIAVYGVVSIFDSGAAASEPPAWFVTYWYLSTLWILTFGLGAVVAMLFDQGLVFFDLRRPNTYAERGRYDAMSP